MVPGEEIGLEHLDKLIERHKGFIIRTASKVSGKYVNIEHDDCFSIALKAFAEAVEKYDETRGSFLSFAKLVMEIRIRNYMLKESRTVKTSSLEELYESGYDFACDLSIEEEILKEEIREYKKELFHFGLTLEILADTAPKHKDTRKNALRIAEKAGNDRPTAELTYSKRKLPIRAVARLCSVTEKIVKGSKNFILAAMVIFIKKYPSLSSWVKPAGGEE